MGFQQPFWGKLWRNLCRISREEILKNKCGGCSGYINMSLRVKMNGTPLKERRRLQKEKQTINEQR